MGGEFTQPRSHLLAEPCACKKTNSPLPERTESESRRIVVGVVSGVVDGVVRLTRVPDPDGLDSQSEERQRGNEVPKLKTESFMSYVPNCLTKFEVWSRDMTTYIVIHTDSRKRFWT